MAFATDPSLRVDGSGNLHRNQFQTSVRTRKRKKQGGGTSSVPSRRFDAYLDTVRVLILMVLRNRYDIGGSLPFCGFTTALKKKLEGLKVLSGYLFFSDFFGCWVVVQVEKKEHLLCRVLIYTVWICVTEMLLVGSLPRAVFCSRGTDHNISNFAPDYVIDAKSLGNSICSTMSFMRTAARGAVCLYSLGERTARARSYRKQQHASFLSRTINS